MQARLDWFVANTPSDVFPHEVGSEFETEPVVEKAPCDERCWFATGPRCECQCEGQNHGRGWRLNSKLDLEEVEEVAC